MKKKKNMAGLFFSMFLRATVIILGIVIVCFGFVLYKKISDAEAMKKANEQAKLEEQNKVVDEDDILGGEDIDELLSNTEEATVSMIMSTDKKIVVLNGTSTKGLAGAWTEKLKGYGYTDVAAFNLFAHEEETRIIVVEDGVGNDLLQYFPGAEIEYGSVSQDETDAVVDGVDIFIIVGDNHDIVTNPQ